MKPYAVRHLGIFTAVRVDQRGIEISPDRAEEPYRLPLATDLVPWERVHDVVVSQHPALMIRMRDGDATHRVGLPKGYDHERLTAAVRHFGGVEVRRA